MAASSSDPVICVVVPTRNRADLVLRLLRALDAQRGVHAFEVVVVDDASIDDTSTRLRPLEADGDLALTVLRTERQVGPAAARNKGWRAARAPLVAFTDDDCLPQPDWLSRLVAGLAEADLVQGSTIPDPAQTELISAFSRTVQTTEESGFYETCNMGYRRDALARVGGFDEGFRRPFGEDTDLAWRVKETGGRTAFAPDAVVYHAVWPQSFVAHLRDLPRREGVVHALKRNPGLRDRLPRRWFWARSHPPALLAAAGVAAIVARPSSLRRWSAAALTLPYIRYRTRTVPTGRPRNRPAVIPLALLSDLVEVGVLAAASVRYRTLLL